MERGHTRIHRSLAVLAPPRRFELLMLVLGGTDRSVSQLARAVRLSQSCTTRHLQALERAGLVKGFRDGKRVVFRPVPRDAEATAVLASLTAGPSRRALEVIPVASTAELEPPPVEAAAESTPARARAPRRARARSARTTAPEPTTRQDAVESGISAPVPSPGRRWAEIEDYLL
jgi:DNA-binding transcriptional ArsR family regulator